METLTNMLLSEVRLAIPFKNKTSAEALTIYNRAQKVISDFINSKTSRMDYYEDANQDADLVFAPTQSSYENLYLAYLKIKFGEYDGEDITINDVDATAILIAIDEGNIVIDDTDSQFVTYTIPIIGTTLNRTFKIMPPTPHYVDVNLSGNNIIVIAPKNHVAFDIEIEKKKES